jgi:hypothetical protein
MLFFAPVDLEYSKNFSQNPTIGSYSGLYQYS